MKTAIQMVTGFLIVFTASVVILALVAVSIVWGSTLYIESHWGPEAVARVWEVGVAIFLGCLIVVGIGFGWLLSYKSMRAGASLATNAQHETVDAMGAYADYIGAAQSTQKAQAQADAHQAKADAQIRVLHEKQRIQSEGRLALRPPGAQQVQPPRYLEILDGLDLDGDGEADDAVITPKRSQSADAQFRYLG